MEPTQCSETSAFNTQTPGKYQEGNLSLLQHGESLKTRDMKIIFEPNSGTLIFLLVNYNSQLYFHTLFSNSNSNRSFLSLYIFVCTFVLTLFISHFVCFKASSLRHKLRLSESCLFVIFS